MKIPEDRELWQIHIHVPLHLPQEMREVLFDRVADVVHDWEPDDRLDWDATLVAHTLNDEVPEEPPIGTAFLDAAGNVRYHRDADGWHCPNSGQCKGCPEDWESTWYAAAPELFTLTRTEATEDHALVEAGAELGADMDDSWQPMDTSPHDGTPVKLCWLDGHNNTWHEETAAWNARLSTWVAWPSPSFGERVFFTPPDGWRSREDLDVWMDKPAFAQFKAALRYARLKTRAAMALGKLTSVEAYFLWSTIQHGMEKAAREAAQSAVRDPSTPTGTASDPCRSTPPRSMK